MCNKYTSNTRFTIRFSRWSRKGYAVFKSLGCNITIGALTVEMTNASLDKSVSLTNSGTVHPQTNPDNDHQTDDLISDLLSAANLPLTVPTNDQAAVCTPILLFTKFFRFSDGNSFKLLLSLFYYPLTHEKSLFICNAAL